MAFQTWTVLLLTALSAGFLLRGLLLSGSVKGCASGCGSCPASTCALRKLQAQLNAESKAPR